jgi:hypothetical protein
MADVVTPFGANVAARVRSAVVVQRARLAWRKWTGRERVVYNGLWRISPADVRGDPGHVYVDDKPVGEKAQGQLTVRKNVIHITRTNSAGRFHVFLERLGTGNNRRRFLEPSIEHSRRDLVFRFRARVSDGTHVLRAAAHEVDTDLKNFELLGDARQQITTRWQPYEMAFSFDASRSAYLRIDDEDVAKAPSHVFIRYLQVTEVPG